MKNRESGWLVPAGCMPELFLAMHEAVTAPVERLTQMGRAGAALVAERHDAKKEAAKLADLITSLSPVLGGEGRGEGHLQSAIRNPKSASGAAPHPNPLP